MSDETHDMPPGFDSDGEVAPFEAMPVEEPRRTASIELRAEDASSVSRTTSMEAANRSLMDALRIVYRGLQVLMVALVVLFAFSGLQQVNEGERGMKVTSGRVTTERLEPGFVFSLPYPFGEVVKIPTGTVSVLVNDSFWPEGLDPSQPMRGSGKPRYKPGTDGSLLTGDQNIANAQLTIAYHRDDPVRYTRNLYPDQENALVRAAVRRAAVQVVAEVTIDDLLKRGIGVVDAPSSRESSIETRIRDQAQAALDAVEAGITIDRVSLREVRPPQDTNREFGRVNDAVSQAASKREEADRTREQLLTAVAGSAYRPLLDLIDEYEELLESGSDEAPEVLETIYSVMRGDLDGRNVEIRGKRYADVRTAGEVAQIISDAQQNRSKSVANAQTRAQTFEAKLEQFRANPSVFLVSEWDNGIRRFLANPTTEAWMIPESLDTLTIKMSPDPEQQREIEREMKRRDLEQNEAKRRAYRAGKAPGDP